MITAEQANKLKLEHRTMSIVARQREFIYTHIEGNAKLGKSKYNWIAPDEFTKEEIQYLIGDLRERGFEVGRCGTYLKNRKTADFIYEVLW